MISLLKRAAAVYQQSLGGGSTLTWNPQQLGTSVVRGMWVPYAYNDSVVTSGSDVTQLNDLSGNDFHMVIGSNSPNWNSTSKEVEFDYTNTEWMYADMDVSTQDIGSLFWVSEFGDGPTFGRYFGGPGNDANNAGVTGWAIKVGGVIRTYNENTIALTTTYPTGQFLGQIQVKSDGFESWLDGVQDQTGSTASRTADFTQFKISQGFNNSYCASQNLRGAIIVQGSLTTDERQRIEGWLAFKCGIQANLPEAHPYKNTTFLDPASYVPEEAWEYDWAFNDAKTGWNTVLGGDSSTTMFVDSPQLAIAEGGSFPGLETGDTAGHASNPPYGWKVNDTTDALELLSGGGEIALKPSMWDGSSDGGYAPGTGVLAWAFDIIYNGPSGDDLIKGSGATLPSSKIENVGGVRLKINDNFNSQADGLGTDSNQVEFYWSPAPSNGNRIFFAYARIPGDQQYYSWYAPITPGNDRTDLQRLNSQTTNSVFLKTTPREDTQSTKLVRLNEGAGMKRINFTGDFSTYSEIDTLIGDHYEYIVANA